ncbi:MAG: hypothetical protein ACRD9W_11375 [Terriglobia bacterium]
MKLMDWLKELLRDKGMDPPPPRPAGWNKTLDDLYAEKRSLSGHELSWASGYEQEQLRAWARFPKDDEVFEAVAEVEVSYITYYRAPYGGGGKGKLPAGTRVQVHVLEHQPEPTGVSARPLEEVRIEELLVPENDRRSSNYDGYDLFIKVDKLNKEFRLVS